MTTFISADGKFCESNQTREQAQAIANEHRVAVFFYDGSNDPPEKLEPAKS